MLTTPKKLGRTPRKVRIESDVWVSEEDRSNDHDQPIRSPSKADTPSRLGNRDLLKTPTRSKKFVDLTNSNSNDNLLRTPTNGRSSRSQGLKYLTPKSFIRRDPQDGTQEKFSVGDQVLISSDLAVSSYFWLHRKKKKKVTNPRSKPKKTDEDDEDDDDDDLWTHLDGLKENEKVGMITELFEDERGEKKARVRWFARPLMIWQDDGPAEGTPQDYEPWELCYVHDSEWYSAKKVLDNFARSGVKINPTNMTSNEFAMCNKALTQTSDAQDTIPISSIIEKVEVLNWEDWPTSEKRPSSPSEDQRQPKSESGQRLFRCRRVYDSRPMAWDKDGFIKEVDFREVLSRGLEENDWDVHLKGFQDESMNDEALERRRIERRVRIKEKNKRRRSENMASKAKSLNRRNDGYEFGVDGQSEDEDTEDDSPEDNDYSDGTEEEDGEEGEQPVRRVRGRPKGSKSLKRAAKTLPKAGRKAKKVRLLDKEKKRSEIRERQKTLRLPKILAHNQSGTSNDPWARARQVLHVSSTPAWLPCREEEFAELEAALEDSIDESSGCCLYISGVPGTGKTATVHSVINSLQAKVDQGELPKFKFFEINGMKVTEPGQAFVLFWEFLNQKRHGDDGDYVSERCSPREALRNLEEYFNTPSPNRETCVLLVDELDQLVTRKQEVIYNFFNWPNQPHSRLIVVAVANKMDLPESELNGKIRSRLGSNRIQFKPYNHNQLMEILNIRLSEFSDEKDSVFVKDSIQWVSKKIASLTGDVRKALDLCRAALEKVEKENEIRRRLNRESGELTDEVHEMRSVQVRDVISCYEEMISMGSSKFIKQLSLHQSIMLISICKAIKISGLPEVEMGDVISRHIRFSNSLGIRPEPNQDELMTIISSLENMNLILNESNKFEHFSRIKLLEFRESDLVLVLKNDKRFSGLSV